MRILAGLSFLLLFSCQQSTKSIGDLAGADTVFVRIGELHLDPSPRPDLRVKVQHVSDSSVVKRLYSDSTYKVMVRHGSGAALAMYAVSDNIEIERQGTNYLIHTGWLKEGSTEKIKIGFNTDKSKNILVFHHKFRDDRDSLKIIEMKTLIDTVALYEFGVIGRNIESR